MRVRWGVGFTGVGALTGPLGGAMGGPSYWMEGFGGSKASASNMWMWCWARFQPEALDAGGNTNSRLREFRPKRAHFSLTYALTIP